MMKQGKGIFLLGEQCAECGERIGPGSREQPAYWAYEHGGWHLGYGYAYYHRACARRVTKRREAARAQLAKGGAG